MNDIKSQEFPWYVSSSLTLQSWRMTDKQIFYFVFVLPWRKQLNLILHIAQASESRTIEENMAW